MYIIKQFNIQNPNEKKKPKINPSKTNPPKTNLNKISSWDYSAWDKFDVVCILIYNQIPLNIKCYIHIYFLRIMLAKNWILKMNSRKMIIMIQVSII